MSSEHRDIVVFIIKNEAAAVAVVLRNNGKIFGRFAEERV